MKDLRRSLQDLTINEQQDVKDLPREWWTLRGLSLDNVIGNIDQRVTTSSRMNNFCMNVAFVSQGEPKNIDEALQIEYRIQAMQEELNQFKWNEVWDLVPRNNSMQVIGAKWVHKNKLDEHVNKTKNKARLGRKRI